MRFSTPNFPDVFNCLKFIHVGLVKRKPVFEVSRQKSEYAVFFLCFRGMVAGPFKRGKLARVGAKRGKLLT